MYHGVPGIRQAIAENKNLFVKVNFLRHYYSSFHFQDFSNKI